jgi:leucyl aminopeptidase
MIKLNLSKKLSQNNATLFLVKSTSQLKDLLSAEDLKYVEKMAKREKKKIIELKNADSLSFVVIAEKKESLGKSSESLRKQGHKIYQTLNSEVKDKLWIVDYTDNEKVLFLSEGIILSAYRFIHYYKDAAKKKNKLNQINIVSENIRESDLFTLSACLKGVWHARNIVNEPLSFMSAVKLSEEIMRIGKESGYQTEVLNKKRIESLKMGGLLAVNRGSVDPPTFSILSWTPEFAKNEKPYILVGKGLVFDTGGINLKPSGGLDTMKSDKSGAAAVIGVMAAIAEAKLPINIIALIPATDNRPGNNAYVPQDIITMFDGTTVEVLNTDAEGRMILADALAYAKKYNPELVIDLATLTGAAVVAIGTQATAMMGNDDKNMSLLEKSGYNSYERLVKLPLWDEYKEQLKSDFADIKNIGGRWAGAITAGKFLEHFTDYKWVHLDIAGPAYNESSTSYHGTGGSGVGVRLLFDFFLNKINK